jgi:hypothetical protein
VGAVLPIDLALVYQPQKRLVDQRRRLQRVTGTLAAQIAARQAAQLLIDDRRQPVVRGLIAPIPGHQQLGDLPRR